MSVSGQVPAGGRAESLWNLTALILVPRCVCEGRYQGLES